jgi:hypothetical protein
MVALSFPTTHNGNGPLQYGDSYVGTNGVTYVFDGDKWTVAGLPYTVSSTNIQVDGGYPTSIFDGTNFTVDGGLI